MKKLISLILTLSLLLSLCITYASATDVGYTDTNGHWAAAEISAWTNRGIIQGFEGSFRPNDPITRGEFAVILNRMMGYKTAASNTFTDLSATEFYTDSVLKAANYGVITGYPDKTVRPKSNITRQEAFVMIYRAFGFSAISGYTIKAKDASSVETYAVDAVSAFESKGIVKGREDGNLYPTANITRAETIKLLNNFVSDIYMTAGTYSTDESAYVVVNAPDVVLKDMTIAGTLIVAPGVGEGTVTLNNVKVNGDVLVLGGGVNSVVISGSSTVDGVIYIRKIDGAVRIFNSSNKEINCEVLKGSEDVVLAGSFSKVVVEDNITLTVSGGATINELSLKAVAQVTGTGKIKSATIDASASGSSFTAKPDSLSGAADVYVNVAGTEYTSNGTNFEASTGGGGGGGGGGGSSVTVSTVTLYLSNETSGKTADVSSEECTFDLSNLSSYPDTVEITGIKINTDINTKYVVGSYSINTNEKVDMSTFLGFMGLKTSKVTLGKIRNFTDQCTASGSITNGGTLDVTFYVGNFGGYYSLTNDGTTVTATVKNDAAISTVNLEGKDPVALLVSNISDHTGPYELTAKKGTLSFTKTYSTYTSISGLTLSHLVTSMQSVYSLNQLSDLAGITVTLTYGTKTLTLKFI